MKFPTNFVQILSSLGWVVLIYFIYLYLYIYSYILSCKAVTYICNDMSCHLSFNGCAMLLSYGSSILASLIAMYDHNSFWRTVTLPIFTLLNCDACDAEDPTFSRCIFALQLQPIL